MIERQPATLRTAPDGLDRAIDELEEQRGELMAVLAGRRAALPLRFWRQQAHYTVPASDADMARKALEMGTEPTGRILERIGVGAAELADRLSADPASVERMLAHPAAAPLVMLDGEDALAPGAAAAEAGIDNAVALLAETAGRSDPTRPLRFYRPPGLDDDRGIRDLLGLLWGLADRAHGRLPLDGIVMPKVRHAEEIDLLDEVLDRAEGDLGLEKGGLRVALLVESGWAVAQLAEICGRAAGRLCALIFGPADHASDLGLPRIDAGHPVALLARAWMVTVAGAVGVPAIDGMNLEYPVAGQDLSPAEGRERILERMALVHAEALRARDLGMLGKWVGHPAQLFAVLLAFGSALRSESLEAEAGRLETYRRQVEESDRGATIIDSRMSDRATDRHARVLLRQAVALGRFDPDRALALDVIDAQELAEARALAGASKTDGGT